MYPPQKKPKPKHIFHSYMLRLLFTYSVDCLDGNWLCLPGANRDTSISKVVLRSTIDKSLKVVLKTDILIAFRIAREP